MTHLTNKSNLYKHPYFGVRDLDPRCKCLESQHLPCLGTARQPDGWRSMKWGAAAWHCCGRCAAGMIEAGHIRNSLTITVN